jgi:DNA polymerase-1
MSARPATITHVAPVPSLTREHVEVLHKRAVSEEAARIAGLRSASAVEIGQLVGTKTPAHCAGLVIPYLGITPAYVRVRLDFGPPRYLAPSGREVALYVPPAILDAPELDGANGDALIVVEAPIKALALRLIGLHAVGLGGTATTLTKDHRLNGSWDALDLERRVVVILFDGNRRTNHNVARDEARLAIALQHAGAQVRVADLPEGPRGNAGWGPDDCLAAKGADALVAVVAQAMPADPLVRIASLAEVDERLDRLEKLLSDGPFLASILARGESVRSTAARKLAELGVRKRPFERALTKYERASKNRDDEVDEDEDGGDHEIPYSRDDGCFVYLGDDEGKGAGPVCNFVAEIVEDVTVDDGAEQSREFAVEGVTVDGKKLQRITVPAREFASASAIWATAGWGSSAIVRADCMMHIHPAIQYFSSARRTSVFSHTGWRRIEDHLVYLTAGGIIGAAVDAQVRLDSALQRYALPTDGATREQVIEAVRAALLVIDVAPDRVTIPALAAVFRAPLCEWLSCDAVVWLFGPTGALKSSLAALLLGFYGPTFDRERLTASWQDTAASLETKLFRAKDVLVVIDDFAPRGAEDRDDLRRKAAQVIRGVGNGQNRSRMRSDMTTRPDRPPRALVLGTGEDMPSGESIVARTLPIGMRREDVDLPNLSEVQRHAHLFPIVMRAYIEQIISWVAADPDFAKTMRNRFEGLRSEFSAGGHLRAPAAAAHLAIGWRAFVTFAAGVGAITQDEVNALVRRGDKAFREQLEAQATVSRDEDAVRLWLRWLRSLLTGGRVRLAPSAEEITPLPGSDTIGWEAEDGRVHLLPDLTYAAVAKAMRDGGRGVPIKDSTLWGRLEELGLVTPYDRGRQSVKRGHAGLRPRVVELLPHALGDDDGPEDGGGGGSPSAPSIGSPSPPVPPKSGAVPHEKPPLGRGQQAVTHEENGVTHRSPRPERGEGASQAQLSLETTDHPHTRNAEEEGLPPGGSGAIGAEEEEKDEKLLCSSELPPPHGRPDAWGTAGASGAQAGRCDLVTDPASLHELARAVEAAGVVALDVETTGLDPRHDRPRLLQLGLAAGRVVVVDLFATAGVGPLAEALGHVEVVGHNLAFDLGFLAHHFGAMPRGCWDTMLASQIVDGGTNLHTKGFHKLDAVAGRFLGVKLDKSLQKSDWSGPLTAEQVAYAAADVACLLPLRAALDAKLAERSLTKVMQIENDLLPTIVGMGLAGVPVDVAALVTLADERERMSAEARERVRTALRVDNPNSSKQLLAALKVAGLNVEKTNAEALAPYRDRPVVQDLATMRTSKKIADDARSLAGVARGQADGRVRPSWRQIGAPTGRMATSNPNMLGLPKDPTMRACIVAPEGRTFIVADYAAIELRVLAHVTRDKQLTAIFQGGGDPHRSLASILLRKEPVDVTGDERKRAKPVNFGFAFGMGPDRFVTYALKDYGVVFTPDEARRFKGAYLGAYRQVDEWQRRTRARMERQMRTVAGRVRDFANSRDGYTERLNMPVQGTAADGMKRAMALLAPRLAKLDARIILAVHDELLVEAPEAVAVKVEAIVVQGMIEGMAVDVTSVPIVVEAEVRRTWGKERC